jgi:hypothetical protein
MIETKLLCCPFCGCSGRDIVVHGPELVTCNCCKVDALSIENWQMRANRWAAFSDEELTYFGVIITNSGHSLLCEISEELARRKGEA